MIFRRVRSFCQWSYIVRRYESPNIMVFATLEINKVFSKRLKCRDSWPLLTVYIVLVSSGRQGGLDNCSGTPTHGWGKFTCENRDIKKAESILDEDRFQFSSSAEWIVVMVGLTFIRHGCEWIVDPAYILCEVPIFLQVWFSMLLRRTTMA